MGSAPDVGIKDKKKEREKEKKQKHDRANGKRETQNRLHTFASQTLFFFSFPSLFCCVCKLTKLNEKVLRGIRPEMFSNTKQTNHIVKPEFFEKGIKM